jgi:hypothetical protein
MLQPKRIRTEVSVKFASGEGRVDTRPIRTNMFSSQAKMGAWIGPADNVLQFSRRNQRIGLGLGVVASAYLFGLGLWRQLTHAADPDQSTSMMMLIGGVFVVSILFFISRMSTYTFDRNSGTFSVSGLFGARKRPLSDILAVQLIVYQYVNPKFESRKRFSAYQLNLVLDDAGTPRENVSTTANLGSLRVGGQTLATFLGVPLLDQVEMTVNNLL